MRDGLRFVAAVLLIVGAGASAGWAQTAAGRIVSARTGRPIPNALVVLIDSTGHEVAQGGTYGSGGFGLAAPRGGTYQVRVLRIGHAAWESPPFELARGRTAQLMFELPQLPVELPEVVVVSRESECPAAGGTARAAGLLIIEARKAFALAEATMQDTSFVFRTEIYDARLSADPDPQVLERYSRAAFRAWPIQSAPVDSLEVWGFVRQPDNGAGPYHEPTYFAPDHHVLFSDWFLATHCFRAIPSDDELPGWVGLHFRPRVENAGGDISGTLWIDRHTLELRSLEYHYVGLEGWIPDESTGGRLDFLPLPDGGWVIQRWSLRAPIPEITRHRDRRLAGFAESGGEVTAVLAESGRTILELPRALAGVESPAPILPASTADSTPDPESPIRLWQQELPEAEGRVLAASNQGRSPVVITELRVTECVNVVKGCGTEQLAIPIGPRETVVLGTIKPFRANEDVRFAVGVNWTAAPSDSIPH